MHQKLKLEELGRKSISEHKSSTHIDVVVFLDNIRSMHNVGSVFRTVDSFNLKKIVLCGITPKPPHREIHKTALGATESVEWEWENESAIALERYKNEGYTIVSVEQVTQSVSLSEFEFNPEKKYVIILGNEVDGVSESAISLSDFCVEIPQDGTKHSLNVSVCAGIVLWEAFHQLT